MYDATRSSLMLSTATRDTFPYISPLGVKFPRFRLLRNLPLPTEDFKHSTSPALMAWCAQTLLKQSRNFSVVLNLFNHALF